MCASLFCIWMVSFCVFMSILGLQSFVEMLESDMVNYYSYVSCVFSLFGNKVCFYFVFIENVLFFKVVVFE